MNQQQRKIVQLSASDILRFLITDDPQLDHLIIFQSGNIQLDMTEEALYAAVTAVQPYDKFQLNKLAKLLEVAHVHHSPKHMVTHELVEQIRKRALQPNERRNTNDKDNRN